MRLNILYQFNDTYAPYAGVSMVSLFEHNRAAKQINVYILGEELQEVNICRLMQTGRDYGRNVMVIPAKALINRVRELGIPDYRGCHAANLRLFIPEVLEEGIDRILYLDSDTIVNVDLQELYRTNMGNNAVGMVLDSLTYRHKKEIGLPLDQEYFNSGVILFNMALWRKEGYTDQIIQHVLTLRSRYPSPDQDILNIVCRGHIYKLQMQYNMQPIHQVFSIRMYNRWFGQKAYYSEEEMWTAKRQPAVFHLFRFVGEFPWHKNTVHPNVELFDSYLAISRWQDYEKQPANTGIVLKIEKFLYRVLPKSVFLPLFKFGHFLFMQKTNRDSARKSDDKTK